MNQEQKDNASERDNAILLKTLAKARERLFDLMRLLSSYDQVMTSRSGCDLRSGKDFFTEAPVWSFEVYVEADMVNGENLCWWLDLTWNASTWVVGVNVSVTQGDTLIDFPDRSSREILKACEDMKAAVQDLLATVERIPRLGQKKANAR